MTITNLLDEELIKQEFVVFLRNQDVLTITQRGVTTQSDTGTFSAASSHTLATSPTLVKNVRSIVVGGVTLKLKTNYTVAYDTGVISFVAAQTGAYTIGYDTGATDKIFPDFPKTELKISSYPRISVDITSIVTDDNDLSGSSNISGILISVYVYGIGKEQTMDMMKSIRQSILVNKKSFFMFVMLLLLVLVQ